MKNNKLISDIRFILINDWDPIGIGNNSNLEDEYDSYIGTIINILKQQPTIGAIVSYLEKIEKIEMGIDNVNIKQLYDVAKKLKNI